MKGVVDIKALLALGLVLAAVLAVASIAPLAAAQPRVEITKITMNLEDQLGRRLANEKVRIVIWNQSDPARTVYPNGYPIAYVEGVTNETGGIELKLTGIAPLYTDSSGTYNITIAIYKYDRWFLLHQATDLTIDDLLNNYINQTVTADHWWTFRFIAWDYRHDMPLYSVSPLYGPENASFNVYLDNVKVMEIWADENGEPDKLFNISDTEVTFKIPREGWFLIASKKNVTFTKEMYWNLRKGKDTIVPVLVGKDLIAVGIADGTPYYNYTSLIGTRLYPDLKLELEQLTPGQVNDITNYGFTYTVKLTGLTDLCGNDLLLGDLAKWAIAIQADIDGLLVLRSGTPTVGSEFYIPDVSLVYNKKVSIVITFYNVPVLSIALNLTQVEVEGSVTFFETVMVTGTATFAGPYIEISTPVTVIKVQIQVFDKQPDNPQPLDEARVMIEAGIIDPIYTATFGGGYVQMPPFETAGVADIGLPGGETAWGAVKWPVYWLYYNELYGYLPVPYEFNKSKDLEFIYRVRVWWRMPGGTTWVEVTDPENSTIKLNPKRYIEEAGCGILSFNIYVNVFEVKVQLLDLCGRPITPAEFPGATVAVFLNDVLISSTTPGPDGSVFLKFIPGGDLKLRLSWKGVMLRANVTPPGTPEPLIKVDANIAYNVPKLVFPIGDVVLKLTMWDVNAPLQGLNVTIAYFKDGKEVHREGWARTNCTGHVVFKKVPLLPLEPARNEIRVLAYTHDTPYTRPIDSNLLVLNETLEWEKLAPGGVPACTVSFELPTWIYSFKVAAVDHAGTVLEHFKTSIGYYPVTVILVDQAYEELATCCPELCPEIPLAYVLVDFRILNATTEKEPAAVFTFWSQQYFESEDPTWQEKIGIKPHLFVAGAKYHFMVFHGGVLVYNYTITLPRPFETKTVLFNETSKEVTEVEGETYAYTWLPDGKGSITHPIMVFKGAKSWRDGGGRADAQLRLVTWVQTLEVKTYTNAGKYTVPSLNLTLIRTDVLNWTIVGGEYDILSNPATWTNMWTCYAWNAKGDKDGVIKIQVPVWLPSRTGQPWIRNVRFGAEITHVAVLAGSNWTSPGVPDTPLAYTLTLPNATGVGIPHSLYGYIVNWNHTAKRIVIDAREFYPVWTKDGVTFRGNNTRFLGDFWNMTYWSGASKTVRTVAMDGFCVTVLAPPPCPGATEKGLGDVPVNVTAIGETGKSLFLSSGRTETKDGEEGKVKFGPPAVFAYKFRVDNFTGIQGGLPEIDYVISTKQNFEDRLKPYELDEAKANLCPEILSTTVKFDEDHNDFKECVTLRWEAIYLWIEDWSGKPLVNMMVAATKMYPTASGGITTFAFSEPFAGSAIARLLVTPGSAYTVTVYWRDSYLLAAAGAIPRYINIYDSFADEITPRLFASSVFTVPGGFVTSAGGTIKTFVYIGLIELKTKEGKTLSPDALAKITVTITWPDGVTTLVKPGTDGVAPIILNKDTVKEWPGPEKVKKATAAYNPESPNPQSPAGDYKVVVEWAGVKEKIAEKTLRIHRAKLDTPEVREPVYVDVTDVTITLSTPFNTPMAGASVTATKEDGTTLTLTADAQGRIIVPEAPLGKVDVTVTTWNGMPIDFKATGVTGAVTVGNIGKLIVTVVGSRGQGLEGAKVSIIRDGVTYSVGTTDAAGKYAVELPAGKYEVIAEKGGMRSSDDVKVKEVTFRGGELVEKTLQVDVFMTLAGWEMSLSQFVGLLLIIVVLVIVLFIIAHEYAVWRRRRLARAIVPAKPEGA
ncbi:carboxypeptidase-like regulatory domain-containing protein [Thermofilum sp.]|uniref:carboxypeptidase-like regulatory domain-containing protein n=1 Tax=Thermofilum sp. TaxID=1961369 RepID=UPI00316173E0